MGLHSTNYYIEVNSMRSQVAGLFLLVAAASASSQYDCNVCGTMVEAFTKKFIGGMSAYNFQRKIDWFCHGMLGDQVEHCASLNLKYGKAFYELLKDKSGAENVCKSMGFCSFTEQPKKPFHFDCSDCKSAVTENVRSMSKKLEQKINENVCVYLDSFNIPHCQDMAEQFAPLLDFMAGNMDLSYYFCTGVDFCKPKKNLHYSLMKSNNNSAPCKACRYFFKTLKPLEKIDALLDPSICEKVPMLQSKCVDFFNKYGEQLREAAKKYLTEEETCDVVLQCADEPAPQPTTYSMVEYPPMEVLQDEVKENNTTSCAACKFAVSGMKKLLDLTGSALQNSTVVCQMFPVVHVNCDDLVRKVQNIRNKIDFDQICYQELGLCLDEEPVPEPTVLNVFPDFVPSPYSDYIPKMVERKPNSRVMEKFFYRIVHRN